MFCKAYMCQPKADGFFYDRLHWSIAVTGEAGMKVKVSF